MIPSFPLIAVVGPTGTGKTDLAEVLAREFGGELIAADSRQFYRGMSIATAKPPGHPLPDGRYQADSGAIYHLVDIRDPDQTMDLAQFQRLARTAWAQIASRGRLPIIVGGTGLYIEATITDLVLDGSDEKRPFPRLEVPARVLLLSPTRSDAELRARLATRAEEIFDSGVIEEARGLFESYPEDLPALTGIIYPVIRRHLAGELSLEGAKREFVTRDWQLARRQRTWWRRRPEVQMVDSEAEASQFVRTHLSRL